MNFTGGEAFPGDASGLRRDDVERQMLPRGYIDGLIVANDANDAVNDIDIAAGVCRSTANVGAFGASTLTKDQRDIEIPATLIKQLDVAWAPGNGGMRSPSSLANGTWHIFAIGGRRLRDDLIVHDNISTIAANLPGGYTAYRRIGSIIRVSGSIKAFYQYNNEFWWVTPPLDENLGSGSTTSAVLVTLTVPTGIKVKAYFNANFADNSAYFSSPDVDDMAPSATAAPIGIGEASGGTATALKVSAGVWTNTSAQIRRRYEANTASQIATLGWTDPRGRNA